MTLRRSKREVLGRARGILTDALPEAVGQRTELGILHGRQRSPSAYGRAAGQRGRAVNAILPGMTYAAEQARIEMLETIAGAVDSLAAALADIGAAYDQLDENAADRLEQQLFRPTQAAYGRAQRTHAGFADRHGLPGASFAQLAAGPPSIGAKGFLESAADALVEADEMLAELQDSMRPIEVGDAELRAGLAGVRELIAELPRRTVAFIGTVGR